MILADHLEPLIEDSLMSMTTFANKALVQIITGTIRGVNSPHPQKVFLDEIDLMDWIVLQEAFSMAKSTKEIKGQNILTSTIKTSIGPMSRLMRDGAKLGFTTYEWCIREVVEKHDPKKCKASGYAEDCRGRCQESDGFYLFDDVVRKKAKLDPEVWETQWLCENPSKKGLMYPQYTDAAYPNGNLREWEHTPRWDMYLLEDYGFGESHPDVVLFAQVNWDIPRVQVFDELYMTGYVAEDVVREVLKKLKEHGINVNEIRTKFYEFYKHMEGWIGDPSGLTEKEDRIRFGCPMMEKEENSELYRINNGAAFLRRWFRDKKLLIDPKCVNLRGELGVYQKRRLPSGEYTDQPEKKRDHGPDALRYGMVKLFPVEALGSFGVDLSEEDEQIVAPITRGLMDKTF